MGKWREERIGDCRLILGDCLEVMPSLSPNARGNLSGVSWSADEDAFLRSHHGETPISEIAAAMGRTRSAVRGRITRLGIAKRGDAWSRAEIEAVVKAYTNAGANGVVGLTELANRIGRSKPNVCRKARQLGLETNPSRRVVEKRKVRRKYKTAEELSRALSEKASLRLQKNGHPRGMLGKKHNARALKAMSVASRERWAKMTEEERLSHTNKALKSKIEKYGKVAPDSARGSWRAGWREIAGRRVFFRSRWEANYGRYLQWLKSRGEITEWEHEPETFWFEKIKRGVRSYLPDFRVTENDGRKVLHEVKGWMDSRSKTTLARMSKYHPEHSIILIREKQYREIERKLGPLIEGWEA